MREFDFLLPSGDILVKTSAPQSPGLRRTRKELARHGSLGRSFDNKCAHDSTISGAVLDNRVRAR